MFDNTNQQQKKHQQLQLKLPWLPKRSMHQKKKWVRWVETATKWDNTLKKKEILSMSGVVQPLRGVSIFQGDKNLIFNPSWVEKNNFDWFDVQLCGVRELKRLISTKHHTMKCLNHQKFKAERAFFDTGQQRHIQEMSLFLSVHT